MLGYDTDLSGLAKLIAWCDPRRSLAAAYDECAPLRARRCRDLNDRNGILVGAQMKRVEGLLGAITGTLRAARLWPAPAASYGAQRRPGDLRRSLTLSLLCSSPSKLSARALRGAFFLR